MNKNNDVLIGYSRFSAGTYASAGYAFRKSSDAPNTLQPEVLFKAGEASYFKDYGTGRNRWGDYSATVEDPQNDVDMWTIREYAALPQGGVDRWATWWAGVTVQKLSNGTACKVGLQCQSGFCADGVCCNTACGGGVTTDCQACSVKAGAAQDGSCGTLTAGTLCRFAAGTCDQPRPTPSSPRPPSAEAPQGSATRPKPAAGPPPLARPTPFNRHPPSAVPPRTSVTWRKTAAAAPPAARAMLSNPRPPSAAPLPGSVT